jgi:hypothetical protein
LAKSIPDFADLFPEVYEYLQMTLKKLDVNFRNELKGLTSSDPLAKSNIQVSVNQQTNIVEVLGYPILKKLNEPIKGSDFEIVSKVKLEQMPLVLPVESGNMYANLHYTTALWGKDNRAGYFDKQDDLNLRRLPNDGTIYPYLTIGASQQFVKIVNQIMQIEVFTNMGDLHIHYTRELINSLVIFYSLGIKNEFK